MNAYNYEVLSRAVKRLLRELRINDDSLELMEEGESPDLALGDESPKPKVQISKGTAKELLDGLYPVRRMPKW
jgi:hypothetical protein